ncbi:MAG: tyrosine-type recombinase/integrase [Hyphomonadaceae bacterium]|jgi:integrase|nr:tyrosine-type recombinase/integrase [Hyphomonadaceae bacterium]
MRAKITLQSVKALKPGQTLHDTELRGFQVRRQAKAIVYAVRRRQGRRNVQVTIGEHGAWTPDKARKEGERLLRELAIGNDPTAAKRQGITVGEASVKFLEHIEAKRAGATHREYKGHFDDHILPDFKNHALAKMTVAQVERLHLKIGKSGRKMLANRVVATFSSLYGWASGKLVPRGYNPCSARNGVERYKEVPRERQLEDDEIKRLGTALREMEAEGRWNAFALAALKLYLLTGLRRDSIRLMLWENVNFDKGTVLVHVKRRGMVKVHLSTAAMAVLRKLRDEPDNGNPYVIRGSKPGKPYANIQDPWDALRSRAGLNGVRIHDLRHTVGSVVGASNNAKLVAAVLGNTEAAARRYIHLRGDAEQRAVEHVGEMVAALLA